MSYRNPAETAEDHLLRCATQNDIGFCVSCAQPAYHKLTPSWMPTGEYEPFCCACVGCSEDCGACNCPEIEDGSYYDAGESRWEERESR